MKTGDRVQLRETTDQLSAQGLAVGNRGTVFDYHGLWGIEFDNPRRNNKPGIVQFHTLRGQSIVHVLDLCDVLPTEDQAVTE
jgi:hypothetical protein